MAKIKKSHSNRPQRHNMSQQMKEFLKKCTEYLEFLAKCPKIVLIDEGKNWENCTVNGLPVNIKAEQIVMDVACHGPPKTQRVENEQEQGWEKTDKVNPNYWN